MREKQVFFKSGRLKIEALIGESEAETGVVVTHPHPLYGGDMRNNVVESIVRSYGEMGHTTLRFNFRGVGKSRGAYDNGVGEQEDLRAAVDYLVGLGKTRIDLAGYSFGAWISARCANHLDHVRAMVMVSPPVNFMDFSFLDFTPALKLVITGSADDIAPPGMIEKMIPSWNPDAPFRIIQGADHFYWGKTGEIGDLIKEYLEEEGNIEHPTSKVE